MYPKQEEPTDVSSRFRFAWQGAPGLKKMLSVWALRGVSR